MRRAAAGVAVVVTAGCWLSTAVHPAVAAVVVTTVLVLSTRRALRMATLRRQTTGPLVDILHRSLGVNVTLKVSPAFRAMVPRRYGRLSTPVRWLGDRWTTLVVDRVAVLVPDRLRRLRLPRRPPRLTLTFDTPYLSRAARDHVNAVVVAKTGVDGLVQSWDLRGRVVRATWTPRAQPPARVSGDTVRSAVPPRDSSYFLGVGAGGVPVVVDLDNDSPHLALSAGTGAGKSTLAAVIAVQTLLRGGGVVILDPKTNSHRWANGLRGRIRTLTRVEDIHDYLVRLAEFAARRNARAAVDPDYQPYRLLVVVEEANSLVSRLRAYWETHRGPRDPRTSPAVAALAELTHMGRSARVHVLLTGQQVTARAVGGGEARENFGVRMLSRFTYNTWRMLVGPGVPMPPRTRHPGRWTLVIDDQAVQVQVPFLTTAEARRILGVPGVPGTGTTPLSRDVPGDKRSTGDMSPPVLTLSEAVEAGIVPWSREAAKKRLQRSAEPPQPAGKRGRQTLLYRRADLIEWVRRETARRS